MTGHRQDQEMHIHLFFCGYPLKQHQMFHQGFALKEYLKYNSSVNEIAGILGITRQAVNSLYGSEKLDKKYVDKIIKAGLKIDGITAKSTRSNVENTAAGQDKDYSESDTPLESAQDKYIKSLEETVALQKEMIQILKEKLGIK